MIIILLIFRLIPNWKIDLFDKVDTQSSATFNHRSAKGTGMNVTKKMTMDTTPSNL